MKITSNVEEWKRAVRGHAKQVRFAGRQALNATAYSARGALRDEMEKRFKGVTPFIKRAVEVSLATSENLQAAVYLRYPGGKGVDPNSVLQAEIVGGPRNDKRAELAFKRIGLMAPGEYMVPGRDFPQEKIDAYGNVKGSFITQLISYFQAFGEVGYRANMTDKRKRQLAKFGKNERGFRTIGGVQYFVSRGRGTYFGRGSWKHGQDQRLPAGIWARSGLHGMKIKPIFLFVRRPRYKAVLPFDDIVLQSAAEAFPIHMRKRYEVAISTAR